MSRKSAYMRELERPRLGRCELCQAYGRHRLRSVPLAYGGPAALELFEPHERARARFSAYICKTCAARANQLELPLTEPV